MLRATIVTLGLACCAGLGLVWWGGWWLVAIGAVIALAVLAYSAGPVPLSRCGLGEVAVVLFFGLVPVTLTFWLVSGLTPNWQVWCAAVGLGLLGANVLVVNNYRDREDDMAVGKATLAVRFGLPAMRALYLANSLLGVALTLPAWWALNPWVLFVPLAFWPGVLLPLWKRLCREMGRALNPLLGATARALCLYALTLLVAALAT